MEWKDCFNELLHELLYEEHLERLLFNYYYKENVQGEVMSEMHHHNALEIDCVLEGEVFLHFENDAVHLGKNETLLIQPNAKHLFKTGPNGCTRANIQLNMHQTKSSSLDKFLQLAFHEAPYVKLRKNPLICGSVKSITIAMLEKQTEYATMVKAEIVCLLIRLLRIIQTDIRYKKGVKSPYVAQSIELIHAGVFEDFSPKMVANQLHISEGYLMHVFKRETGQSLMKYIADLKIELCKQELVHTDKKISEIASDIGLPNLQHFSIFFKKHTGISPHNFRKMSRKVMGRSIPLHKENESSII